MLLTCGASMDAEPRVYRAHNEIDVIVVKDVIEYFPPHIAELFLDMFDLIWVLVAVH